VKDDIGKVPRQLLVTLPMLSSGPLLKPLINYVFHFNSIYIYDLSPSLLHIINLSGCREDWW